MVRTPHFHCMGLIPGQGTKILQAVHVAWPKTIITTTTTKKKDLWWLMTNIEKSSKI